MRDDDELNPKPEVQNPKAAQVMAGKQKSEARRPDPEVGASAFSTRRKTPLRISGFGLLSDFGDSDFGIWVEFKPINK